MSRAFSLYLDLVRFLAALAVFISHCATRLATGGLFWQLAPLGSDAVAVFFVLSGYVIAHSVAAGQDARSYAVARLARLHSVALPAIVLTLVADRIGLWFEAPLYVGVGDYSAEGWLWQALNSAVFTNRVWSNEVQLGSNIAYWSMSYEAFYYLAFGLAVFLPGRWKWAGGATALLLAGPQIARLAPMWLLGVGAQALGRRVALPVRAGLALWVVSLVALGWVMVPHPRMFLFEPMVAQAGYWRDMRHFYAVAGVFTVNLVAFRAAAPAFAGLLEAAAPAVRWLGARTFALYLFHQPLIVMVDAISPWPATDWSTRVMILVGVPAMVLALAEVSERRLGWWRRFYARVIGAGAARAG